jgi:hypothetical protein
LTRAIAGLDRRVAEQLGAPRERAEQLIGQIVAIGDHHDRRVLRRRLVDHAARVERHRERLARALGVPDDADLAIAAGPGRAHGLLDRLAHRADLVIPGELLARSLAGSSGAMSSPWTQS